ncbi:tRNA (adenosine(37)-N6)-threonylcarbamoyltransferase complex ATPase subunit type 1 TsaE [Chloroflexota bacterium]
MTEAIDVVSHSAEQTRDIGACFGRLAQAGDLFLLLGELGTGKTCLTQGITRALGVGDYAISPSFVLVREYHGRLPLYHVDFYRLDRIDEIVDLGLDDYLYGNGVCVVEWAERGLAALPSEHLLVRLDHLSANGRRLRFEPRGERYVEMLRQARIW